jgi:predicted metalloprotease
MTQKEQKMSAKRFVLFAFLIALLFTACSPRAKSPLPQVEPQKPAQSTPTARISTREAPQATPDIEKIVEQVLKKLKDAPVADPQTEPLMGAPSVKSQEQAFIEFVAGLINKYWTKAFEGSGHTYSIPKLVYVDRPGDINVGSCGLKAKPVSAGPFYCAENETVYLVSSKLWDYRLKQGGVDKVGDFALAYIVAHEYGHHVQNRLQITNWKTKEIQKIKNDMARINAISVLGELQADCLAGVWSNSVWASGRLEAGDFEEAVLMASYIGDDVLGIKDPTAFTHGYAQQRIGWFKLGYSSGKGGVCDPFTVGATPPQPTAQQPTKQKTATQAPTRVNTNMITEFFVRASDKQCKTVDDGQKDTLQTIRCQYEKGFQVDFDEWFAEQAIGSYVNDARKTGNLLLDEDWKAKESGFGGMLVAWKTKEGKAVLMWTVNGHRITGTALRDDGDVKAIKEWFMKSGSLHHYKKP